MSLISDRTAELACAPQRSLLPCAPIALDLLDESTVTAHQLAREGDAFAQEGDESAAADKYHEALGICKAAETYLAGLAVNAWQMQAQRLMLRLENLRSPSWSAAVPPPTLHSISPATQPFWDEVNTSFNYRECSYADFTQYVDSLCEQAEACAEREPFNAHCMFEEASQLLNWWATKRSAVMEPEARQKLRDRAQLCAARARGLH